MRTTLDLPDPLLRKLKARAATDGTTMKELLKLAVERHLSEPPAGARSHRIKLPLHHSKKPGSLHLTNAQIDDLLA